MTNKRAYIKPECILLDERIEMEVLMPLSNSSNVDENGNPISGGITSGGNGDGSDLNGDDARGGFFDEEW